MAQEGRQWAVAVGRGSGPWQGAVAGKVGGRWEEGGRSPADPPGLGRRLPPAPPLSLSPLGCRWQLQEAQQQLAREAEAREKLEENMKQAFMRGG